MTPEEQRRVKKVTESLLGVDFRSRWIMVRKDGTEWETTGLYKEREIKENFGPRSPKRRLVP